MLLYAPGKAPMPEGWRFRGWKCLRTRCACPGHAKKLQVIMKNVHKGSLEALEAYGQKGNYVLTPISPGSSK
jgi:hypothetical protein